MASLQETPQLHNRGSGDPKQPLRRSQAEAIFGIDRMDKHALTRVQVQAGSLAMGSRLILHEDGRTGQSLRLPHLLVQEAHRSLRQG